MPDTKEVTYYVDPVQPGIIRQHQDPTAGMLCGMRAEEFVKRWNSYPAMAELVQKLQQVNPVRLAEFSLTLVAALAKLEQSHE